MTYRFGPFQLDPEKFELRNDGDPVPIEPQVFDLLVFLVRNRDRIVSKDDLIDAVWEGRIVSDAAVTSRINLARKSLGDSGARQAFIKTFPKRGFRFVGDVEDMRSEPVSLQEPGPEDPHQTDAASPEAQINAATIPGRQTVSVVAVVPSDVDADPEDFDATLRSLSDRMTRLASRLGGEVITGLGDVVACVIGLKSPSETHSTAAIELGREAVAGSDGSTFRVGVARGDAISVDSQPGKIDRILAEATRLARDGDVGSVNASAAVWHSVRAATIDAPFQRAGAGFVARQDELALLTKTLAALNQTGGRLIGAVGEAGIGKTSLIEAFLETDAAAECNIIRMETRERGAKVPFEPIPRLLAHWPADQLHAPDTPGAKERQATLRHFADPGGSDPDWDALAPAHRRRRVVELFRFLLSLGLADKKTILVVEDLHWIDVETETLLGQIFDDIPGSDILVIVSYRPEYRNPWGSRSFFRQLPVEPLEPDACREVLSRIIGHDDPPFEMAEQLIQLSGGIPLFLIESARNTAGQPVGDLGDSAQTPAPAAADMAPTIRDILSARIFRLSPLACRTLQSAAVLGVSFSDVSLQLLTDENDAIDDALAELRAEEILIRERYGSLPAHRFRHALFHQAAYASTLRQERIGLHARALDILQANPTLVLGDPVPTFAHHALQSQRWQSAADLYRRAGDGYADLSAYSLARDAYLLAIGALRNLPREDETFRNLADLHLRLRPVLVPLGDFRASVAHLEKAGRIAQRLDDNSLAVRAQIGKSYLFSTHGRLTEAIAAAQKATDIAPDGAQLSFEANLALGQALSMKGDWFGATKAMIPTIDYWRDHPAERFGHTGTRSVWCHGHIARSLYLHGAVTEAFAHATQCHDLAQQSQRPLDLIFAQHRLSEAHRLRDEMDHALSLLEQAYALAVDVEAPIFSNWVVSDLAALLTDTGAYDRTAALLSEHRNSARQLELNQFFAWIVFRTGQLNLAKGSDEDFLDQSDRALALAGETGDEYLEVTILQAQGEHLVRTRSDDTLLKRALGLAEKRGYKRVVQKLQAPGG